MPKPQRRGMSWQRTDIGSTHLLGRVGTSRHTASSAIQASIACDVLPSSAAAITASLNCDCTAEGYRSQYCIGGRWGSAVRGVVENAIWRIHFNDILLAVQFLVKSCQEFIRQPLWDFHPLPPLVADLRYQRHQRPFIVLLWPEDFAKSRNLILWAPRAGIEPPISRTVGKRITAWAKQISYVECNKTVNMTFFNLFQKLFFATYDVFYNCLVKYT